VQCVIVAEKRDTRQSQSLPHLSVQTTVA
jgi:hypothetical protein